ncbi:MAG TPA: hypothetical protein VHF25_10080 [Nitriliruptorales bacterium]|nr:hypothetical protein [Nitriliruptorales bacterium]
MDVVLIIMVLLLVGAGVVLWLRGRQSSGPGARPAASRSRPQPAGPLPGPQATVTLDIDAADPDNASVQRLVRDAASRTFRVSPDVKSVTVQNRAGIRLGTVERHQDVSGPGVVAPEMPQRPPRRAARLRRRPVTGGAAEEEAVPKRTLADRFDLPDAVLATVRRPDDAVDVIRAILEAAQLPVEVHENVIRSGDDAVIVASLAGGSAADALSRAFLRFQKSGASQGVVVSLGYLDPRDVRRRHALAPNLHYSGLSAIQRMADAVALGADPLKFATEPGTDG